MELNSRVNVSVSRCCFSGEFTAIKRCCSRTQSAKPFFLNLCRNPGENASRWESNQQKNKATENRGEGKKGTVRSRSVFLRQDHTHSDTHTHTRARTSFVYSDTPQMQMYMRVRCPRTLSHSRQLRSRPRNIRVKRRAKRRTETLKSFFKSSLTIVFI